MTKVGILGAGQIGQLLAAAVTARLDLDLVWLSDISPSVVGRRLPGIDIPISAAPTQDVDVVFQTTSSSMGAATEQVADLLSRDIALVSSCEEMTFPIGTNAEMMRTLDQICRTSGARVLAVGVNPGFVMDALPLFMSAVQVELTGISVRRVVNLSTRREALRRKMGVGQWVEQVRELLSRGRGGHVGLRESMHLVAHGLGASVIEERRSIDVVEGGGLCTGLKEQIRCLLDGSVPLVFDLEMAIDAVGEDTIRLDGAPPVLLTISGGVEGDSATVGRMINAVPAVLASASGFHTLLDLPIPHIARNALRSQSASKHVMVPADPRSA